MNKKKKVAILQSNYIPWKGYFDLINSVEEFIILDGVQYTRRDWRNRNLLKTKEGLKWITIPVEVKGKFDVPINQVNVAGTKWRVDHWNTIKHSYTKAPYFKEYEAIIASLYLDSDEIGLSKINHKFISAINSILGIKTVLSWCSDYESTSGKNERLISLCKQAGASIYLSGPAAKDYLDENLFLAEGIEVEWMDYTEYPEYNQLFPPFQHTATILDLIFNTGSDARNYMKSFN